MNWHVRKVAVLGSGVMGSAVAAHFANAGIPSLVLDIVPREPNEKEKAAGLTTADRAVRDRIARDAVQALLKTRPAPLFVPERIALIETGNLEDDLARLAEADWVIEAVKEDMAIKKKVLTAVAPHIGPDAVLTTNTSGLSVEEMAAILPKPLRGRFLGTHFFNPPRYMKLFEVIRTKETVSALADAVESLARTKLGKGIVEAKDTPNFIANRIGIHAMMATLQVMEEMGLTIEEVDALTGPALGRPKTATFRLADLVGLDTLAHVAGKDAPPFLRAMVEKGLLGRKSGAGFYKKTKGPGGGDILTLDLATLEYRGKKKAAFPELEAAKSEDDTGRRIAKVITGKGRGGEAAWKILSATLIYAAERVGEICDRASDVDAALRWGFNWELGPFEVWDAIGFRETCDRLRRDGHELPAWVKTLHESGAESLYQGGGDSRTTPTVKPGERAPVPVDSRAVSLEVLRGAGREVRKNPGASLIDLGDGVLGLEFHSKMNAIGQDTIQMMVTAAKEAEANWRALVVANQSDNFSVGANLMLLLMEAQEGNWEDIEGIVRAFQMANDRLEQCRVPVVMAPHGMALGGGCEVVLAGHAVRAAAETYIGLVEVGAGLIPAGGGCMRLYRRIVEQQIDRTDIYPALRKTFETIGMAKVATSAEEARGVGFLRPRDGWSMNGDHRIADAKDVALALAEGGWVPAAPDALVPVMGRGGIALLETALFNMVEGKFISEHDRKIGRELARILSGGDIPGPSAVSAGHLLDLERESFLRLCGERKSLERMQSLLKTGKPLRN